MDKAPKGHYRPINSKHLNSHKPRQVLKILSLCKFETPTPHIADPRLWSHQRAQKAAVGPRLLAAIVNAEKLVSRIARKLGKADADSDEMREREAKMYDLCHVQQPRMCLYSELAEKEVGNKRNQVRKALY